MSAFIFPLGLASVLSRRNKSTTHQAYSPGEMPEGVDVRQWSANPYANFDYKHTWWQKLLEGLGFRTNYDQYKESMAVNAREYEAQLAEKAHNEEYDSPLAQSQRYREAGINPDINGDVSAGSSSPMEPDPNAPIQPNADVDSIGQFANIVLGLFSTAVGLSQDVLSLGQIRNAVETGNIANAQGILDFGMKTAASFIPDQYPEGDSDWINRASSLAFDVTSPFLSKRQQKQYRQALNALYSSAPTQASQWKSWKENATNKIDWFQTTSSKFFGDGSDEVLRIISDNIMKYSDKIFEQGKMNEAQSAEKQAQYLNNIDTGLQAEVENVTNKRNLESGSIDAVLNECLNSIVQDLRDRSESNKRGHSMAQVALLVFSLFRMMNFSTGPKGSSVGVSIGR